MLLLADGARLFEPVRDAAIEFIFTMDRQVIAIASWIARRTSDISRCGRGLAGSSADFTDCPDYFSGAAQSAIRDPQFSGL
jgi:hypothetical protein